MRRRLGGLDIASYGPLRDLVTLLKPNRLRRYDLNATNAGTSKKKKGVKREEVEKGDLLS